MLYNVIEDSWGGITYVPTALGKVLLVLVLAALLAAAALFAGRRSVSADRSVPAKRSAGRPDARQLAFCAMSIALGTILSNIKLFEFPFGGSVTLLSMLIICLPGYWFGLEAGLITGVAYGVLQLIIDPYVIHPAQLVLDYLLAFGALGLSGLFSNSKNGLLKGYMAGVTGRWICTALSGWIFFAEYAWEGWNPFAYTLAYNGAYIFTEATVTLAILAIPDVKNSFARIKGIAGK